MLHVLTLSFPTRRSADLPSQALEANAPGHAALEIELLRRRAGPPGMRWRVEWNRDECIFREPALSGAVVSLPFGRPAADKRPLRRTRSEEHTSELQSLMRISYAVFCLKKKKNTTQSRTRNEVP